MLLHLTDMLIFKSRAAYLNSTDAIIAQQVKQEPGEKVLIQPISKLGEDLKSGLNDIDGINSVNETQEFLAACLSTLSVMLAYGSSQRQENEEIALRSLLPSLQTISAKEIDSVLSQNATDIAVAIMTRRLISSSSTMSQDVANIPTVSVTSESVKTLSNVCCAMKKEFLFDAQPAMRALGIRNINVCLKESKTVSKNDCTLGVMFNVFLGTY
jgi:hypothetical protein